MNDRLQALLSNDFHDSAGVITSQHGLRRYLAKSKTVKELRLAIDGGAVTEREIEEFTDKLMRDFERGKQFPHEFALAAIAVALENRRTKFAEDYLIDLARLHKIIEMNLSPGVAGACLKHRYSLPRIKDQRVVYRPESQRRYRPQWTKMSHIVMNVGIKCERISFSRLTNAKT